MRVPSSGQPTPTSLPGHPVVLTRPAIPIASDFASIRAISLEHRRSPNNPLGVKGAGEGGIIPVGGLMANAIAGALSSLGAEPNELPLSPPRV
jgi:aerobic carbon-monoxide dehydrogenase large subunit